MRLYNIAHYGSDAVIKYEYDGTNIDGQAPNNSYFCQYVSWLHGGYHSN